MLAAATQWATNLAATEETVVAVGCFGSYARGDSGVGSDLDLVVIVASGAPPRERHGAWAVEHLPVPAEVLVYTIDQWRQLRREGGRFYRTLQREARWIYAAPPE